MISVNKVDGNCISSSAPVPVVLPNDVRRSRHEGLRRFRGTKSVDESQRFLDSVLYSKAKDKSRQLRKTKSTARITQECPPVEGREHLSIQTDVYLEELVDKIDEADQECQTDPLLDRPSSPLFVPALSGIDAETQINPGDLFDFDQEVQPFLECLVSETVEQSLIEISAEDRIKLLQDQQKIFDARQTAEVTEYLKLDKHETKLSEEKGKKLKEHEEAISLEEEMTKKVAACVFAQDYLSGLLPKVYRRLERQGYFVTQDREIQEVEENFWPWLIDEVDSEIQSLQTSCSLIDNLIDDSVLTIAQESVIRPAPSEYPKRYSKKKKEKSIDNDQKNEPLENENIENDTVDKDSI